MEVDDRRSLSSNEAPRDSESGRVRKRKRLVISCSECHRRKQKCDRGLPCANCKSRNKESACHYEAGAAPSEKERRKSPVDTEDPDRRAGQTLPPFESLSTAAANWGYSQAGGSTLGFLKKIETVNGETGFAAAPVQPADDEFALKERYKSLIRQLPAKSYIQRLVDVYFEEFNDTYFALDPDVFRAQLAEWNNLSFSVLSSAGPQGLSPDLRAFPALLFQVLAMALLVLADEPHEFYDHLKYAGNMTFEDLAADYSDSGVGTLTLLGKRHITLTAVQSGFLRANYLKYTGKVTESWHSIGSSIKDAQEIGMHRDSLDPRPASNSPEDILENQWLIQRRRRMYMTLLVWDVHCGVVLGRPGTIDWRSNPPTLPLDAPFPKDRRKTAPAPRDEERDPPTPVTMQIALYHLIQPLVKVMELEQDGPCPKSYDKVDRVHEMTMRIYEELPAYLRLEYPDTRWDNHPGCQWLPAARNFTAQIHFFDFIAVHRPYVFHRKRSRVEALHASMRMLDCHLESFRGLDPKTYRNFLLFFGSFDAVVMMASIFIFFPREHIDLAPKALVEFQETQARFEAIRERNKLAKAARGVLQAIYVKFKKAVEGHAPPMSVSSGVSTIDSPDSGRDSAGTMATSVDMLLNNAPGLTPGLTPGSNSSQYTSPAATIPRKMEDPSQYLTQPEWGTSNLNFDFGNMAPLFPMGDIIYNDLTSMDNSMNWGVGAAAAAPVPAFEGDFGGDSFWSLMNQYNPGPM
ncbi:hypothetical protein B0T11DRAFT_325578 [Plectosphaerella cucumerina]|uniref:Zn(2)-C6 fungal-type domain-containing protein n=1 Tax=Plectosphaerella cucumerina TaxID=40658 RepID=A0A8K0THQ2_9PEZI|nr:hypothetical protein B0T11DRAFT_325578 [Plectosphaerella cucumerina]